MHFLHVQQRGTTSFHECVQTSAFSPKFEHAFPTRCSAKRDIKQHADLYGKTRVKRTTQRAALCVYAVFLRISSKSAEFTRVLPYKMSVSINCIFSRVLPCKSQHWCQNRPQNGPPNRTRIALNTRFVEVIRVCVHKNTGFYRVKWLRNLPKWPTRKTSIHYAILPEKTRVKWRPRVRLYRVFSGKSRFWNPSFTLRCSIYPCFAG